MRITMVNHASILLEPQGTGIWCDPWALGKVVNDCGALYSPSPKVPVDRVEYIWISHEHSDHLHFPTLRTIPESERKRITILHQRHSSLRVVNALKKLGFEKIIELPLYRWIHLKPGIEVLCGSVGSMDSFLTVRAEGECILNLNDCITNDLQTRYIKKLVGKVSVLLTQFSIAEWIGNNADEVGGAARKIRELKYRIWTFRPEFTIPFASFSYACNQENSWMNKFIVTPAQVAALNLPGVNFMYPGDLWDSQERIFHSAEAVAKFSRDLEHLVIDPTPPSVDSEKVRQAVISLLASLRKRFSKALLGRIKPFEIYTHDTNCIFTVYPGEGRCEVRNPVSKEEADRARYLMCSQVAWYAFAHTWGWNVLEGSGTYFDREFQEKGFDQLWRRCVMELSTDILRFDSPGRFFRTLGFLWGKKFEILYYFLGKPISDEVVSKVEPRPTASFPRDAAARA